MIEAMLFSLLAGAMIPLGGLLARGGRIRPMWLEQELRHTIIAFGGGALVAAVALVLVPEGAEALPALAAVGFLLAGGGLFALIDRQVSRVAGNRGQMLAMLADFLPEAVALGALFATGEGAGALLALLIALQNLPEGFNAWREAPPASGSAARRRLLVFCGLALLGPAAAVIGHVYIADHPGVLGALMLAAAGGILYLIFEDIAPQTPLENTWAPPLGAVAGFALGLTGHLLLG